MYIYMANVQNLPSCIAPYSQCSQQSCNNGGSLATECSEIRNLYGVISQKDSEISSLDQIRNNLINEGNSNNLKKKENMDDLYSKLLSLEKVKNELENKVRLLNSRQDLAFEESRLKENDNQNSINELDNEIAIIKRKMEFSFEKDLNHNALVYLLSNILLYSIIAFVLFLLYRLSIGKPAKIDVSMILLTIKTEIGKIFLTAANTLTAKK
jgi:hypothetical protein